MTKLGKNLEKSISFGWTYFCPIKLTTPSYHSPTSIIEEIKVFVTGTTGRGGRQTDRRGRQADSRTDGRADTDRQTVGRTDGRTQTGRQTDSQTD